MVRRNSIVLAQCGLVVSLHGVAALGAVTQSQCQTAHPSSSPLPEPVASYRIVAELNVERHTVTASETIDWRNPSDKPTDELYLHAYLNAFSRANSRFLRSYATGRSSATDLSYPGRLTITRLVAKEHPDIDLLPRLGKHNPDDLDDATDLRIALPFQVSAHATLSLDLDFEATLPALMERCGFSGSFHAVTQWFPKIARRDPSGAWRHFAYDAAAEFCSDFGDYDVTLDVPSAFVIAAPGIPQAELTVPGRRKERYCVRGVHDFAWFAWDRFIAHHTTHGSIQVRLYSPPDQQDNVEPTLDTVRWGLDFYASRYLPYPYPSLTLVHPPDRAAAAGAMEYPQLIAIGEPWYYSRLGLRLGPSIALHELAHQWFYGTIASDEYLSPLLDEGLASWAETEAVTARFGSGSLFDSRWLRISEATSRRAQARRASRRGPLAQSALAFGDFPAIVGGVYARFPTLLETITRVYPTADLSLAIRSYAERFRFRHPEPEDFVSAIKPHLPAQVVAAISTALFSDGWVDFAVRRVTSTLLPGSSQYSNRILVERRGTFDFPIQLEVEFANGQVARRNLDSVASSTWIDWPYSSAATAATLDPDLRITIDDDLENQTLRVAEAPPLPRLATLLHAAMSAFWSLGWP